MDNSAGTIPAGLTRRDLLKQCGAAGLGALVGAWPGQSKAAWPNIVFVFSDQQRNASWPGGGDPQVITPNLDRLAREGAVFSRCISNYPLCSPYRASLLTGRYPQATCIMFNVPQAANYAYDVGAASQGLPTSEVTIADLLKKAGYATGYVGKWHLYPGTPAFSETDQPRLVPAGPHRHGFDYWRVCHNYGKRYDTRCYDDRGKEFVLPGYAPTSQMDMTLEFIEKNAAGPFCVFLSTHPPHAPYTEAPQRFIDMYPPDKIRLRPNVPKDANTSGVRDAYIGYFSHVTAMDHEMGRLMTRLAQLGIADNTILCYSSDHGDMLGSHNLWAKRRPWEESIDVPFIVRWPGRIPAGRRLDQLFSTPDITPTLLGLAGVPVLPRMQGIDMSAALRGKDISGPESAFIMSRGGISGAGDDEAEGGGGKRARKESKKKPAARKEGEQKATARKDAGQWRGVRTPRYTYARIQGKKGTTPWVLYDNEKDPYQMRNLVEDRGAAGTLKELDAMVERWRKRLGDS